MKVLIAAAVLLLVAQARAADRIPIVATTTDLRSLVEAVGGERVSVASLVPPHLIRKTINRSPRMSRA